MAKAVNERRVEGVTGLADESDSDHGLRIVLGLRRDADPAQVLNGLYLHTDLQRTVAVQMVFLMGQPGQVAVEPRRVGMVDLLTAWNAHQVDVLTKRLQFELRKAQERRHVVLGLIIGATNAQAIVRIFQQAPDRATAKAEIQKKYKLSEIQAETIAQMTLAQVTKLDASKYEEERKALDARIAELQAILGTPAKLLALLKAEYKAVKTKFGDARRTIVDRAGTAEVAFVEHIIDEKQIHIQLSPDGLLRVTAEGKRRAKRTEPAMAAFAASTLDYVLFVSHLGKVYAVRANKLPETTGKGESIRKILSLGAQERIVGAVTIPEFAADRYLIQFTKNGRVKKSALAEYRSADTSGLADLTLLGDDAVQTIFVGNGSGHYLVVTTDAKALRFPVDQVRASGRVGQGVQAITLSAGAAVLTATGVDDADGRALATVTTTGYVKQSPLADFPVKGRATGGVQAAGLGAGEQLVGAQLLTAHDDLVLWPDGDPIRLPAKKVSRQARDRRGSRPAELPKGSAIRAVTAGPAE